MSTSSLFLIPRIHTEFLVIVFDHAENRLSTLIRETRRDCCLKSLKEKQIILYSQNLTEKTFRVETITFLVFWRCLPELQYKDHIHGPRTIENGRLFEFQATYLCVELETSGSSRGTKKLFSRSISGRCLDSGKISKIMTFSHGPRTTHCTLIFHQTAPITIQ